MDAGVVKALKEISATLSEINKSLKKIEHHLMNPIGIVLENARDRAFDDDGK